MLHIVSTPIGNLEDISYRAVRIMKESAFVACEDTRTTGILLKHYGIETPMMSFHSYSSGFKIEKILAILVEGKDVALVSDAGTPGISDPAYALVTKAIEAGVKVSPIPGASAVLSALVCSGLPTNHFLYLGFMPVKKGRQTLFKSLIGKEQTVVVYESVHRIEKTLSEFVTYFGPDAPIVVARELTKLHEEFFRGTMAEAAEYFSEKGKGVTKGEFVIVF